MCWLRWMTTSHEIRPVDMFIAHTIVFLHTHSLIASASGCSACGGVVIFLLYGDQIICSRTQTS